MAQTTKVSLKTHVDLPCGLDPQGSHCRYDQVPPVVQKLAALWETENCFEHIGPVPIPSHQAIIQIIHQVRQILFPGYFTRTKLHAANLEYYLGKETTELYERLAEQVTVAIRHDCRRTNLTCTHCEERGHRLTIAFIETLPHITGLLTEDIRATLAGDPATSSADEVIFCYPGLLATSIFRMAHELFQLGVPIIPRIMTEHAHSLTGIDIHPGASIGPGLFIDHGTGVVIGETTIIGRNVRLYQGVTLGALSLPRDAGTTLQQVKRHPTIENEVIIYANTTILGGDTVIGAHSVIGGNIWLTESVPPNTRVLLKRPELLYSDKKRAPSR
ncbi:MAG: serine acetyltransferase [Desulfobulbaceae bacterium]|uniref:Serine acetyltransferase n=1 Tax=Candidatus Desulfatifera sulfidica TaxID=2841691 RepID=A0A8J6NCE7_9BACT|nr:serine acetyltransferase [Candidatus Desulfatifera sulfidica]